MKNHDKSLVGILLVLTGLVWTAIRGLPHVAYRYQHPELTDTQLQIIFLSSLCWWDLLPFSLTVIGFVLVFRASK